MSASATPKPTTTQKPDPIIRAGIFAGHGYNANAQKNKNDPGAVLYHLNDKVISYEDAKKKPKATQISESSVNVEMRDRSIANLPGILRARGINPDVVEVITDKNEKHDNLSRSEAAELAKLSDTIPVEIHQNAPNTPKSRSTPNIFSIVRYDEQKKKPIEQTSYDFAKNFTNRLDPLMPPGITPKSPDGISPDTRGLGFLSETAGRGVIFEGNALYNLESYNHYLANKEHIGQAIAEAVADNIELELAKKIAANPTLAERAYLIRHPSRRSAATQEAQPQPAKTAPPSGRQALQVTKTPDNLNLDAPSSSEFEMKLSQPAAPGSFLRLQLSGAGNERYARALEAHINPSKSDDIPTFTPFQKEGNLALIPLKPGATKLAVSLHNIPGITPEPGDRITLTGTYLAYDQNPEVAPAKPIAIAVTNNQLIKEAAAAQAANKAPAATQPAKQSHNDSPAPM